MLKWFLKPKLSTPTTGEQTYTYTAGDLFTGGAERFAYHTLLLHPLQGLRGSGQLYAGQLQVTQPRQVFQSITLPAQAVSGNGIVAGALIENYVTQDPNQTNDPSLAVYAGDN